MDAIRFPFQKTFSAFSYSSKVIDSPVSKGSSSKLEYCSKYVEGPKLKSIPSAPLPPYCLWLNLILKLSEFGISGLNLNIPHDSSVRLVRLRTPSPIFASPFKLLIAGLSLKSIVFTTELIVSIFEPFIT